MKIVFVIVGILIPVTVAAAGAFLVNLWLGGGPGMDIGVRLPVADKSVQVEYVPVFPAVLVTGTGRPSDLGGAWPRFRGGNFDAVSAEKVPLANSWPPAGPPVLWSVELGEGYAGAAVLGGKVYILDYDEEKRGDALRCLSLADRKEIWRLWYPLRLPSQHGVSRTVPAVTEKFVVTLGPACHAMCADAQTGKFLWGIDLVHEYGAKVPLWYASQCPLIDDGRAIIAPAGSSLMIAVDCATGEVLWKTPNPHGWKMTHSCITPMDWSGRRMYLYCASGGLVGVSAIDGKILWEYPGWKVPTSNAPAPVIVGDGRIFLTGGYHAGSIMLSLTEQDGKIVPKELFRLGEDVFGCEMQTPILYKDHFYGVMARDKEVGRLKEQLVCLDLQGRQVWTSGPDNRFGPYGGPYIIADNKIFVMNDHGVMTLLEATPKGYRQLARAKVLAGKESWAPMAVAGGRLIIRDKKTMVCLDVREK